MQPLVDSLKELFAYNQHVNQTLIHFFQQHSFSAEKAIRLFSHILNAHHVWLSRIANQQTLYTVWQVHPPSEFEKLDRANHTQTQPLITASTDFSRIISYQTFEGTPFQNRLSDILLHVVNHSTYHRGQIASIIREHGYDPPVTDYIFYQRDKT